MGDFREKATLYVSLVLGVIVLVVIIVVFLVFDYGNRIEQVGCLVPLELNATGCGIQTEGLNTTLCNCSAAQSYYDLVQMDCSIHFDSWVMANSWRQIQYSIGTDPLDSTNCILSKPGCNSSLVGESWLCNGTEPLWDVAENWDDYFWPPCDDYTYMSKYAANNTPDMQELDEWCLLMDNP